MTLPYTRLPIRADRLQAYLTSPVAVAICLVLGSALVNLALLGWFGIQHGGDTARYLDGASNLLAGRPFQEKQTSYLGYVVAVAFFQSLGASTKGMVIFQIAVAALAALALYDLGRQLSGRFAGLLAAGLLIVNIDIARWHIYVLTDSLYISLVVLSTWFIHRAAEKAKWWYAGTAVLVLCAAFIRPNGWVIVPITAVYWIVRARVRQWVKYGAAALTLLTFLAGTAFIGSFRQGIQAEGPDMWLRQGVVIWQYNGWRVPMPVEPHDSEDGWVGSLGYPLRHPWPSARLAVGRVALELLHARPFYSATHNALVVIAVLMLYPLAVLGYLRLKSAPLARLMSAIIGSHMLIVALTFADWDGRFLLYVLPLICLFAACEAAEQTRWRLVRSATIRRLTNAMRPTANQRVSYREDHIYPCVDIGVEDILDNGTVVITARTAGYEPRPFEKNWTSWIIAAPL
jgi:4-amino-4-deoxy-L-arabinose transferase-like glycosyltransferase